MRQWSPDDLFEQSVAVAMSDEFVGDAIPAECPKDFVEDFPFDGLTSFLGRLEIHEREALFQLVREDLHAELLKEVKAEQVVKSAQEKAIIDTLSRKLADKVDTELKSIAHHAVDLAIVMAEQVTRRAIELDQAALQTAVETIVYRAKRGTKFTVVVNPEDATYLEARPDDMARLNIEQIDVDQRIERGGCLITADGQEWDYTVTGRLDRLADVVRESIQEAGDTPEEPS